MTPTTAIPAFLIATLLGLLIGLERERKREQQGSIFAGIRTFPLIALFGAVSGQLSMLTGSWLIGVALLALSTLLLLAYWRESAGVKLGGTTEITALVAFGLGVIAGLGDYVSALAAAVIATGVLSFRQELRNLVGGVTQADMYAIVQFAVVSLVILPLVPNESYGPWGVWNPRTIWLLVVLISGISFIGYILSKVISTERSIGLSGFIGGIASSTAVTLSFSGRSKHSPALSWLFAAGVLAATAIATLRLAVLIGVLEPRFILPVLPTLLIYCLVTALGGWLIQRLSHRELVEGVTLSNPFELRTALTFAALFAIILLLTRAAQEYLGAQGIHLASALAGISQLDAITLTLTQQVTAGLDSVTASRALAFALVANSFFKAVLAFSVGSQDYARVLSIVIMLAAALALLAAWLVPI